MKLIVSSIISIALITSMATHAASEPIRHYSHKIVAIKNERLFPVIIRFKRPDPGFKGSHVLVKDRIILRPDELQRIMVYKKNDGSSHVDCYLNYPEDVAMRVQIPFDSRGFVLTRDN